MRRKVQFLVQIFICFPSASSRSKERLDIIKLHLIMFVLPLSRDLHVQLLPGVNVITDVTIFVITWVGVLLLVKNKSQRAIKSISSVRE